MTLRLKYVGKFYYIHTNAYYDTTKAGTKTGRSIKTVQAEDQYKNVHVLYNYFLINNITFIHPCISVSYLTFIHPRISVSYLTFIHPRISASYVNLHSPTHKCILR